MPAAQKKAAKQLANRSGIEGGEFEELSFGRPDPIDSLTVDGSDANNVFFGQSTGRASTGRSPYSFSQDAVEEFQVSANGYAAEVGRAGGGVINVITKSGTNDWHGTALEFFRDKALNANSWETTGGGSLSAIITSTSSAVTWAAPS